MTADEIRALPAGNKLDALVAERVMEAPEIVWDYIYPGGREKGPAIRWRPGDDVLDPVPRYSADLAAAWEVVEALRRRFDGVALAALPRAEGWGLTVWDQPRHSSAAQNVVGPVDAGTPALAVCRTALLAMGDGSRHAPEKAR